MDDEHRGQLRLTFFEIDFIFDFDIFSLTKYITSIEQ